MSGAVTDFLMVTPRVLTRRQLTGGQLLARLSR